MDEGFQAMLRGRGELLREGGTWGVVKGGMGWLGRETEHFAERLGGRHGIEGEQALEGRGKQGMPIRGARETGVQAGVEGRVVWCSVGYSGFRERHAFTHSRSGPVALPQLGSAQRRRKLRLHTAQSAQLHRS